MTERRSSARVRRRFKARFSKLGLREHVGFTTNVGPSGLFVSTRQVESPGTVLRLSIDLPGRGCVTLAGAVAWAKMVPPGLHAIQQGGFGVNITDAPEDWVRFVATMS